MFGRAHLSESSDFSDLKNQGKMLSVETSYLATEVVTVFVRQYFDIAKPQRPPGIKYHC